MLLNGFDGILGDIIIYLQRMYAHSFTLLGINKYTYVCMVWVTVCVRVCGAYVYAYVYVVATIDV